MAKWNVKKFGSITELNFFLSGAIFGSVKISGWGQSIKSGTGIVQAPPLVGKTLIFTTPAKTVTFVAGADPAGRLTPGEIKTQIESGGGVTVAFFDDRLVLLEATPSTGLVLNKTGTANTLFGFDVANPVSGKVYGTPFGSAPTPPYAGFGYSTNDNTHVVYLWE